MNFQFIIEKICLEFIILSNFNVLYIKFDKIHRLIYGQKHVIVFIFHFVYLSFFREKK
jgi:hypothetical protein